MDQHTFYLYNQIISHNNYLYKKLWEINDNHHRIKFIHNIYEKIYSDLITNKNIINWRIGMPNITQIYYCTGFFNYYNYKIDLYLHNTKDDITILNVKKKIHYINDIQLNNELSKYTKSSIIDNIKSIIKHKYNIIHVTLYNCLNSKIPKDIIYLIKQYLY
jgi:hypothetical protein